MAQKKTVYICSNNSEELNVGTGMPRERSVPFFVVNLPSDEERKKSSPNIPKGHITKRKTLRVQLNDCFPLPTLMGRLDFSECMRNTA